MKLAKYSGILLIGTGVIHNLLGLVMGKPILQEIINSGFVNTIHEQMDRNAIFWFLFGGFMMMILGKLMQDYLKENEKPLPVSLGYYLLALSLIGCIMMPISGFWIVLPQAFLIIAAGRHKHAVATFNEESPALKP
jgi:hypothetical protein